MVKCESKRFKRIVSFVGFQLTFPYNDYMPSHLCQLPLFFLIPFLIPLNLFLPEVRIRLRHPEVLTTIMPMPKAAVDKHTRAILSQYNIKVTGEAWVVETVAEALLPQIFAYMYLRLRVRRANKKPCYCVVAVV